MTTEDRNAYPLPIFCGGSISALSLKGSGTVEAPFLIGSEADLRKFQEAVETEESQGQYYQLTADIDMSEESMPAIGSSSHPFQGTFDGNGHSINGLVTASGYLFDRLQGTVQNLTLLDYKGKADKTGIVSSIAYYVGSNADGAQAGHIQNCYVSGTIEAYRSGTVAENDVIATGLCVNVYDLSTIENSYFKGNIKVSSKTIDGQTVKNTGLSESDANTYLYVGGMAKAYSGITSTVATNSYASFNYECAADASFTSSQVNGLFAETIADSYLSNCYFVCSGIDESSTKKLSSESELNGKLDGCTGWKTGYYRPVVVGTKYYTVTKPDESRTETYLDAIPEDNPTPNYIMNFTPADEAQANDPYLWQLPNMAIYRDKTTTEVVIELDENGEPKKDESGEIISHTITHEDKADYLMGAVLDPNTDFSYKRSANATRTKGTLTYKLDAQESAYWRTLCLPGPIYSDLLPEGCKLYLGGALSSGNTMNIIKVDTIPAGTPCLIYVPAETSVPIYMLGDIKESPVLAADNSALQGTFQHTIGSNWCSTVSVASDNTKTLNTGTSVSLSPFSAYVGSSSDIILMDYLLLDELDPELAELIQGSISGTTDVYVRRTLNKAGWNTLCLPFDMTAEEIETTFGNGTAVEELKEVKTDAGQYTLVFKTVTGIEAGHPYLIKPTNSGNLYTLTERTLSTATTDISKETTDGTTFTMKASLGMAYLIGGMETDTDYYFTQGGNTLYRVADGQGITFRGFRSWFEIKEPSGTAAPLNIFKLQHDDGTTTDLQLVDKAQTPANDSQAYDLTGRPVTVRGKGIYVIGNKVRIVK